MDKMDPFSSRNQSFFNDAVIKAAFAGKLPLPKRVGRIAAMASVAGFQRKQTARRAAAARRGLTVPGILIASVTRDCNLDCTGCYSKVLRGAASRSLSDERFLQLFREAADLGVGTIMIAGGEPLLRRKLIQGAAAIRGPIMPVFTNGTLIDQEYIDLFASSRLLPILSVEGHSSFTARRRGEGIHERAMTAAAELRRRGIPFGFSVTLTNANADSVLGLDGSGDSFLEFVELLGAAALFLIEFVPVAPGSEKAVLTSAQKARLAEPGFLDRFGFMTVSLPGDEEAFGGCLAAGRGFLHLADDGALEACPFAPFSDSSVADRSLADGLSSPLMAAIRMHHNELTETKGGCALWNKRGWVTALSVCGQARRSGPTAEKAAHPDTDQSADFAEVAVAEERTA